MQDKKPFLIKPSKETLCSWYLNRLDSVFHMSTGCTVNNCKLRVNVLFTSYMGHLSFILVSPLECLLGTSTSISSNTVSDVHPIPLLDLTCLLNFLCLFITPTYLWDTFPHPSYPIFQQVLSTLSTKSTSDISIFVPVIIPSCSYHCISFVVFLLPLLPSSNIFTTQKTRCF